MSTLDEIQPKKRGRGRPRKDERVETKVRPNRTPISGNRDILTVSGMDPNYHYRWVLAEEELSVRIQKFIEAGYEFASSETHRAGQNDVYASENVGSIVRKPAGDQRYLYLMRILKEWYEEDQALKELELQQREGAISRERNPNDKGDDGQYGSVKIS